MTSVSLVVSTLNRSQELTNLLQSLVHQDTKDFEVIIVDQNTDDRLVQIVDPRRWPYPVHHLRTPGQRGVSRGRNAGWKRATGRCVLFPDDDCWYPPEFLSKGIALLNAHNAASVTGRATDEAGRDINGRFEKAATWVDRVNVWTTQIEWVAFYRREALLAVDGFDEEIGIGASTPWGASEGQDLTLRLLAAGLTAYYDPSLCGFHAELDIVRPDAAMIRKGRSYARGFGYVLRRHHYGFADLAYWLLRSCGGMILFLIRGKWTKARYYANVTLGRLEGWFGQAGKISL
jgi:glycosyltransferase involved in cell wall biosynthesis